MVATERACIQRLWNVYTEKMAVEKFGAFCFVGSQVQGLGYQRERVHSGEVVVRDILVRKEFVSDVLESSLDVETSSLDDVMMLLDDLMVGVEVKVSGAVHKGVVGSQLHGMMEVLLRAMWMLTVKMAARNPTAKS
jgi:hypothetical protein